MGQQKITGLYLRKGIWHIDKIIPGFGRLCESTEKSRKLDANNYLLARISEITTRSDTGRKIYIFRQAATHYLQTETKKSLARDAQALKILDDYIGDIVLTNVHHDSLKPFVAAMYMKGRKASTINRALAVVRRIMNLAAYFWRDEDTGLTWIESAPMIRLETRKDGNKAYPLNWDEQEQLIRELAPHLQQMALFAVNTGTRDDEVCTLRWDEEIHIPELNTSVFVKPGNQVKNTEDRLIVLNSIAMSVINSRRNKNDDWVFTYRGEPIERITNNGWRRAWRSAGLPTRDEGFNAGVHNLKHTFGRRLRAAGVHDETRKALMGHTIGDITTHYSAAQIEELIDAAEKVVKNSRKSPALTLVNIKGRKKSA